MKAFTLFLLPVVNATSIKMGSTWRDVSRTWTAEYRIEICVCVCVFSWVSGKENEREGGDGIGGGVAGERAGGVVLEDRDRFGFGFG